VSAENASSGKEREQKQISFLNRKIYRPPIIKHTCNTGFLPHSLKVYDFVPEFCIAVTSHFTKIYDSSH
jgi:hypothetical protein